MPRSVIFIAHHGLSERRATRLLGVDRSGLRYRPRRPDDAADRALLRALAASAAGSATGVCARWPNARGGIMNLKKVYRLYRQEGLTVRRRRGRKRALGMRAPMKAAERPNDIWVLDFMSDVLDSGRRFRVFAVEDQLTRTGLVAEVDTSLPGGRVVRVLDGLVAEHGKPAMIVSDNGRSLNGSSNGPRKTLWRCFGKPTANDLRLRQPQETAPSDGEGRDARLTAALTDRSLDRGFTNSEHPHSRLGYALKPREYDCITSHQPPVSGSNGVDSDALQIISSEAKI